MRNILLDIAIEFSAFRQITEADKNRKFDTSNWSEQLFCLIRMIIIEKAYRQFFEKVESGYYIKIECGFCSTQSE